MKGKIIGFSLLICLVVAVFALPGNTYAAAKFSDVSQHWAEKYINEAVAQGIVKGYPDGKFLPDNPVTRAEFATIINKALGNTGTTAINFKDVPRDEWYYAEISKAVAATYVAGYSDNTYQPNNSITRQEAAVMISRFVPTYGHSGRLTSFSDYRSIDEWAYTALQKVNGKGYIGGYTDGGIHPKDKLTRAQAAKIICDILDEETIVKTATTVKSNGTKLSDKIYSNNVIIHQDLDDGSATIENAVILGTLTVEGGGLDTVTINNSRISNAVVDRSSDSVRVLARGETSISTLTASRDSILQTTSLASGFSGFNNIFLKGSATATLRGSFPLINLDGASATLSLESGSISELQVTSNGRRSTIKVESGTTISNATVGSEAYFRGAGTISHMAVNANGVTYETKPKNWTIASRIETPAQVDPALEITFSPKNGATKVSLNTPITLTFSSAMKLYDGKAIKDADIPDFITLRRNSASGTSVKFTAKTDSAKKVITLTPSENLDEGTRYYVILDKNALKDAKGNGNAAQSIYFNTGDSLSGVTFSPKHGATGVSARPSITLDFEDEVIRHSGKGDVDDAYAAGCVTLKQGTSAVAFTASINRRGDSITITPTKDLENKSYTVAVVANKLKTSNGTAIPAASVTWTVGYTDPELKSLSATPGDSYLEVKVTPNVNGTIHVIALDANSAEPSPAQIAKGKNKETGNARAYKSGAATANSVATITLDGLVDGTTYDVWAVLESTATKGYSKAISLKNVKTTLKKVKLSNITVSPGTIAFNKDTTNYNIIVPSNVDTVNITATEEEAGSTITIDGKPNSIAGIDVDLSGVSTTRAVSITVSKPNKADNTYTLNFNVTRDPSIILSIDDVNQGSGPIYSYTLPTTEAITLNLSIVKTDSNAIIQNFDPVRGLSFDPSTYKVNIEAGTIQGLLTFEVKSGNKTQLYVINFLKPSESTDASSDT